MEIEDLTTIDFFKVNVEQSEVSAPGVMTSIHACPYQHGSRIDYKYDYYFRLPSKELSNKMRHIIMNENWLLLYDDIITKISIHKKEIKNKWITYTLKCEGISFNWNHNHSKAVHYIHFSVYEKDIQLENITISSKNREYILKLIDKNTIKP